MPFVNYFATNIPSDNVLLLRQSSLSSMSCMQSRSVIVMCIECLVCPLQMRYDHFSEDERRKLKVIKGMLRKMKNVRLSIVIL